MEAREDWLLRQVLDLAAGVLQALLGKGPAPPLSEACQSRVGLDPDLAAGMPPDALVALLSTDEGFDGERGAILGLTLALRARDAFDRGDLALARKMGRAAARLLDEAGRARPDLRDGAMAEVRASLDRLG